MDENKTGNGILTFHRNRKLLPSFCSLWPTCRATRKPEDGFRYCLDIQVFHLYMRVHSDRSTSFPRSSLKLLPYLFKDIAMEHLVHKCAVSSTIRLPNQLCCFLDFLIPFILYRLLLCIHYIHNLYDLALVRISLRFVNFSEVTS